MSIRIVDVTAPTGHIDTLKALGEQFEAIDVFAIASEDGTRCLVRLVCETAKTQALLDAVQRAMEGGDSWRLIVQPIEALVPALAADEPAPGEKKRPILPGLTASREELFDDMSKGAAVDSTFLILVLLSTIVTAIGLLTDNMAVIIGAMVIAPLLGPNLAFAFGTALGDRVLMGQALWANGLGFGLTIILGLVIGLIWPGGFDSVELLGRTKVGFDGIALALASGAAAVLSLASGLSSALVGVMVAVALMPPAVTAAIMLGAGRFEDMIGAAVLLGINIVCVNLAAQAVFVMKGVKPRTHAEQAVSRAAVFNNFIVWIVMLLGLVGAIVYLRL